VSGLRGRGSVDLLSGRVFVRWRGLVDRRLGVRAQLVVLGIEGLVFGLDCFGRFVLALKGFGRAA
jgi:hypothetical protein